MPGKTTSGALGFKIVTVFRATFLFWKSRDPTFHIGSLTAWQPYISWRLFTRLRHALHVTHHALPVSPCNVTLWPWVLWTWHLNRTHDVFPGFIIMKMTYVVGRIWGDHMMFGYLCSPGLFVPNINMVHALPAKYIVSPFPFIIPFVAVETDLSPGNPIKGSRHLALKPKHKLLT